METQTQMNDVGFATFSDWNPVDVVRAVTFGVRGQTPFRLRTEDFVGFFGSMQVIVRDEPWPEDAPS